MTDLFDEVEERLRSDRYKSLALRAAPWALGLFVVAIAAIAGHYGWREHQGRQVAEASEKYAAALETLEKGRGAEAFQQFGGVAKNAPAGYKTLALMQQGALRLAEKKRAEAVALYDAAAEAAPGPILQDAARLKAALALLDSGPFKDVEGRLKPLLVEGRPYRTQAMEALAFAKLAAGDQAGARSDFSVIALMPGASEEARGRADAARGLIDSGSAKEVPAIIKAAALSSSSAPAAISGAGPAPQHSTSGSQ